MMGHRARMNGDEEDAFHARRMYGWGRGVIKKIKRRAGKRERAAGRRETWLPPS